MLSTLGPGQVAHLSSGSDIGKPNAHAVNAWAGPGGPPFERERRRGKPDMVCTPLIMLSASRAGWLAVRETIRQNCSKTNRKWCFLAPPRLLGLRRLPAGPGGPAGIAVSLGASSEKPPENGIWLEACPKRGAGSSTHITFPPIQVAQFSSGNVSGGAPNSLFTSFGQGKLKNPRCC